MTHHSFLKTASLTALALIAFAANSVLCRLALGNEVIDAASFTIFRLLSGIVMLLVIIGFTKKSTETPSKGSWFGGFMLFIYAITFSYAYISLDTGTGALILFGAVQITMILLSVISGKLLHISEWLGVVIAFIGFIYLILPNVTSPSATGFILMTISGIAWGIYTLQGRNSKSPLMDTAYNFLRTTPFVVMLAVAALNHLNYSSEGIALAVLSGSITSGIGYAIWYVALGGLSSVQAAVLQLSVPVIAALGGVLFVSEAITLRFTISGALVLSGILLVVVGQHYSSRLFGTYKRK